MRILIFGATGMLGQALVREARKRGHTVVGASRKGAECAVDLADRRAVGRAIAQTAPTHVINAAGLTDLDACEKDPAAAYTVNAGSVALMAEACRDRQIQLVQVSTDHFFTGDGDRKHDENAPVQLVNEYARSKHAGEQFALALPGALAVRTNVAGLRGWPGRPTFFEWAADALARRAPLSLFDDFFTSTIDAGALAVAIMDLTEADAAGLLNVASREVANKKRFVEALASAMGITLDWTTTGKVAALPVKRAESLGLDVTRAEALLGYRLPDLAAVTAALAAAWRSRS
jgi:dTDP-4-dehydrorhamnose reductase